MEKLSNWNNMVAVKMKEDEILERMPAWYKKLRKAKIREESSRQKRKKHLQKELNIETRVMGGSK